MECAPLYICHENYYSHLTGVLKRLSSLTDCYLLLDNSEVISTHYMLLSAFSPHLRSMRQRPGPIYLLLRDVDPYSVKSIIEYMYTGSLIISKHNLTSMNRTLHTLDVNLGINFYETDDIMHFTLNQSLKCDIINKMWCSRNEKYDVKIITSGMQVTYAHSVILSACSDELRSLLQTPNGQKTMLIMLLEFSYQDIESVLRFCYHGEVEIDRERASEVCQLAKILGIKDLYNTLSTLVPPIFKSKSNNKMSKISCLEHKETTRQVFRALFECESLSDVQLICSDHTFKVHSAVLNLSPYFQRLFQLQDWRHSLVFLAKMSLDSVQAFVDYMYYGEIHFNGEVHEFTSAMQGLIDFNVMPITSVEMLQQELSVDNVNISNGITHEIQDLVARHSKQDIYGVLDHHNQESLPNSITLHTLTNNTNIQDIIDKQDVVTNQAAITNEVNILSHDIHLELQNQEARRTLELQETTVNMTGDTILGQEQQSVNKVTITTLTYTCDTCSAVFYSRRSLKLHMATHPQNRIKCKFCDETFDKPSARKIHERCHDETRPLICTTCGKTYATISAFNKHVRGHVENQVFHCEVCGRTCTRKDYLEEHMRTHTGSKPYKCSICGKGFVGKTGLNHHAKVHEPRRHDFVCEVCGKAFTRKALWTHMKTHNKQNECQVCGKLFATPGTLRAHVAMSHIEKRLFSCDLCPKKFALQNHLNRHRKNVHDPTRLFHCSKCTKVFSSASRLAVHENSMHVERSYACKFCPKIFAGRSALIYHQRNHTGDRPHVCSVCPKSFLRPDALQKHMRSHTNERPFKCSVCESRCSSKSALNKHMKRHKTCPVCNKTFASHAEFIQHEKENHVEDKQKSPCEEIPREEPILQTLQTMSIPTENLSPHFIQVYVPNEQPEQPTLQDEHQFIQVYVPEQQPQY